MTTVVTTHENLNNRKPIYNSLYVQVLIAIIIGILLGHFYPDLAVTMKPLSDGFIKLIKMIIAPIIFCTVVTGIASMEGMKEMGKIGGLTLLYFEIVSTIAIILGLIVVNLTQPGSGMHIDLNTLNTTTITPFLEQAKPQGIVEFLVHVIPSSIIDAFAKNDTLQILLFSLVFAFALHQQGGKESSIFIFIENLSLVFFRIINLIMRLAPIGAFGAIAFTIGSSGLGILLSLGKLLVVYYSACLFFVFGILGLIARVHGFSIWKFIKFIKNELLIVLGTASSETVFQNMITKLEKLGAKKSVVGLVLPTGYSFNLDGSAIYLSMTAIFIAQATGTPMSLIQQLSLLAVLLITSKGTAGISGSSFIVLVSTLSVMGNIPVVGAVLILGIDRFLGEARGVTNVIGNGVATLVVAKWTNGLDVKKMKEQM